MDSNARPEEQRSSQGESVGQGMEPRDLKQLIHRLNSSSARLLLVLLACDGNERLEDLPDIVAHAGLAPDEHNTHGKKPYARAMEQLLALGFLKVERDSIRILFETAH